MAVSGHNGNNESFISNSSLVGLSIYDENANEIKITKSSNAIDIFIERDKNVNDYSSSIQYINATEINASLESSIFLWNSFKIRSNNASVHIELKSVFYNTSYLLVIKYGSMPILNSTYSDLTSFKIFCPSKYFLIK